MKISRKQLMDHMANVLESAPPGQAPARVAKALAQEIENDGITKTVTEWLRDPELPEVVEKAAERPAATIAQLAHERIRALVEADTTAIHKLTPGSPARERALDLEVGRRLNGRAENQKLVKLLKLSYYPGASEATSVPELIRKSGHDPKLTDLLGEL